MNKGKEINKNKNERKMKNKEILIGKKIKISSSPNKELIGITGEIIDETRNLFVIKTRKGIKKIIKKQIEIKEIKK